MPFQFFDSDDRDYAAAPWCAADCIDKRYSAILIWKRSPNNRKEALCSVMPASTQSGFAGSALLASSACLWNEVSKSSANQ